MTKPNCEPGSCRKLKSIPESSYCPPCWEQDHLSLYYFKSRNLESFGCCHRLYPHKANDWSAHNPDATYWTDENWYGMNANVDSLSTKNRTRRPTNAYTAEPANGAIMTKDKSRPNRAASQRERCRWVLCSLENIDTKKLEKKF